MGSINLTGLSTGIDTSAIVQQLMEANRNMLYRHEARKQTFDSRLSVMNTLQSRLNSLASSAKALADVQQLRSFNSSSSKTEILTAEASNTAFEGTHSIEVHQLATADRWVHGEGMQYAEDYVGQGSFIYSYNNKETVINTTDTTTLQELANLINNDANNPGVTASLLKHNGKFHLVLSGNQAGSDYSISINASSTEVWQTDSTLTVDGANAAATARLTTLDQFSGTLAGDERILIQGRTHDGQVVDAAFEINPNMRISHLLSEIEDAFGGGVKAAFENGVITVTDKTSGESQMELSLSWDPGSGETTFELPGVSQIAEGGAIANSLATMSPDAFENTQQARDSLIRVDGYPSDGWISRSTNTVTDVIAGVTLNLNDVGEVNLTLSRNTEGLKEKITQFADSYNAAVMYMQEQTKFDPETGKAGILMGNSTVTMIRNMLRSPLTGQAAGFLRDVDSYTMASNIGLELDRDGMLNIDNSKLDKALSEDYDAVLALIAADKTGISSSSTMRFHDSSSQHTKAGNYEVQVTIVAGEITGAQIRMQGETEWRDAEWSGNVITGESSFDSQGRPVNPENSLQLSVDLSREGTYNATVRVKGGFAGQVAGSLESMLKTGTGTMAIEQKYIQSNITALNERIRMEEARLERQEARLIARFARMEKTLNMLQSQLGQLMAFN